MKQHFFKVAAITPDVSVGDVDFNTEQIIKMMQEAKKQQVRLCVFPELCLTSYTCNDLFLQDTLLDSVFEGIQKIISVSKDMDMVTVIGFPFYHRNCLYNVAGVICNGELLGLVPKQNIPNYSEFYEGRHFSTPSDETDYVTIPQLGEYGESIPFGTKLLFQAQNFSHFILGIDICEDLWVPVPPSCNHALAGATVIANLSASNETTGKDSYRQALVCNQSARLVSGYVYADAGEGESSTDLVFSGHNLIAENGTLLAESVRFQNGITCSELDLGKLISERRRMSTFTSISHTDADYDIIEFSFDTIAETKLTRRYPQTPFVPQNESERERRCKEIFNIQALGLKKRLAHTNCKHAVIGISGGLDSTLALLVTAKSFDMLNIDRSNILCVTMPCFGTTDRTYNNACELTKILGATLREIPIHEAVNLHFAQIGHDSNKHDVTYENSQARQRTLILMNLANEINGMVIGTGDMSELALGWATYNGDHMSMYGVNSSVPKTLVRYLVEYYAKTTSELKLHDILLDVLDTPVSPELLPPKDGEISQKTEDLVGPYELHDFFLYFIMRFGFTPKKVYRLATYAFENTYDSSTIYKWLRTFYWRFFSQQFKRSCLPDGPKVGSVALSPRGDWRMPSDASVNLWMKELDEIKAE